MKKLSFFAVIVAACTNDPAYIPGEMGLEAGMADGMGEMVAEAKASLTLPIKTETMEDAVERAALAAELGVDVPYVKLGDIEVSVEWTAKNLDATEGIFEIQLNGANELFEYDPSVIVLSSDDEAPETPGLDGDIPIRIAPNGTVSGLFREDQVREASVDLDAITRGNVNPFNANLSINKNAESFQPMTPPMPDDEDYVQMPTGDPIPRAAFAQMIRIDLVFKPSTHMILEYVVRVRDVRGIVHELLGDAMVEAPGELTVFEPMEYAPMPPMPMPMP